MFDLFFALSFLHLLLRLWFVVRLVLEFVFLLLVFFEQDILLIEGDGVVAPHLRPYVVFSLS